MKHVSPEQAVTHSNSDACTVQEYGNNGESDAAVIEINGRYPEQGASRNKIARAIIYITKGEGTLTANGAQNTLREGDVVFIDPGDVYSFDGQFTMLMSCTPPWSPDQYEAVE